MKTIIVYMSRHGCTEKAVKILAEHLGKDISVKNLKNENAPDIDGYDTVIIGGSIHAGQIQTEIRRFCQRNMEKLLKKKTGLFVCCMETGKTAEDQFNNAFPEELRNHATEKGMFGGEFDFAKMSAFEKRIIEKVANITESISLLDRTAIKDFAGKFR
ncbi:MAG: flavodoxin domain-containing protein [Bacteroidales bacterium]|nr:MAG: flavodoxin domain-containing protein [Bacteroidales bacterium]